MEEKQTFGMKVLELLEDSVIVQSIVTLGTVGTLIYLNVVGQEVTQTIEAISYTIIGFWFGSKIQHAEQKHREAMGRK